MYKWRTLNQEQKKETLETRQLRRFPLHGPPHFNALGRSTYHLTAANYEHKVILGKNHQRMEAFSEKLCALYMESAATLYAWCVLPNHWHALVSTDDLKLLVKNIGKLHGHCSYVWNKDDGVRGRKCWHCCSDRRMRSEDHFYAARNYIHHNPVRHGYVTKWDEWVFSSAKEFLAKEGREHASELWVKYPVLDMGKEWDE